MNYRLALALLASLSMACGYKMPTTPDPVPVVEDMRAADLILTAGTRGDTRIDVAAEVRTTLGKPVAGQLVTFGASNGTVSPASAVTGSDGIARAIATVVGMTTINASTASIARSIAALGPPSTTPTPLAVQLLVGSVTLGTPTMFSLAVTGASGAVTVTGWSFGDGASSSATSTTVSYLYGAAGNYAASVSVRDASGRTASSTATARVNAPPPPAPINEALTATAACSAAKVGAPSNCNVTVTEGAVVRTGEIRSADWVWGDGGTNSIGGPTAAHVFSAPGTFVVYLTVTLTDGRIVRTTASVVISS